MKNSIFKVISVLCISSILLSLTIVSVMAQEKKPLTVRLSKHLATHHMMAYVAEEKGYFKEEKINVEWLKFYSSGEVFEAMMADKLDWGQAGISAPVAFLAKGAPFKIVGGDAWYSAAVVTKPERAGEFKTLKDFKGKKVATTRLATGDVAWRWGIFNAGLDLKKDVTVQEYNSPGDSMAAVIGGHADAVVLWEPFPDIAETKGLKIVMFTKQIYPHPCCRQVVSNKFIERNGAEGVVRFLKTMIKADRFIKDPKNANEVVDIGEKHLLIGKDVIRKSFITPEPALGGEPRTFTSPMIGAKQSMKFIDMMAEIGYISKEGAELAKKTIDDQYLTQAYIELGLAKTKADAKKMAEGM